jgi:hypothetical protein
MGGDFHVERSKTELGGRVLHRQALPLHKPDGVVLFARELVRKARQVALGDGGLGRRRLADLRGVLDRDRNAPSGLAAKHVDQPIAADGLE